VDHHWDGHAVVGDGDSTRFIHVDGYLRNGRIQRTLIQSIHQDFVENLGQCGGDTHGSLDKLVVIRDPHIPVFGLDLTHVTVRSIKDVLMKGLFGINRH